jgi:hypothetical protein
MYHPLSDPALPYKRSDLRGQVNDISFFSGFYLELVAVHMREWYSDILGICAFILFPAHRAGSGLAWW